MLDHKALLQQMLESVGNSMHPTVAKMKVTTEDSPWHRESSVWVHTEMVLHQFLEIWNDLDGISDRAMFLAGLAGLFHDFGKPSVEELCTNKDGVEYRRYKGHEQQSSAEFRLIALDVGEWYTMFGPNVPILSKEEVYVVATMIQHHLPYQYGPELQLGVLQTIHHLIGDCQPYFCLLLADCMGRISDDHTSKINKVTDWIIKAEQHFTPCCPPAYTRHAIVMVGVSGSGKSTYVREQGNVAEVFNQDAIRIEHFGDSSITDPLAQYHHAFTVSCADEPLFKQLVTKRINEVAKSKYDYVLNDNTNLSRKARRQFISAARQSKRAIHAVVLLTPLRWCLTNNEHRTDHIVPDQSIKRMFRAMTLPTLDEVDSIQII